MTDAATKLSRIQAAILASILEMTPEELRQEFIDDGEDPDLIVAEQRAIISRAIAARRSPAVSPDSNTRK